VAKISAATAAEMGRVKKGVRSAVGQHQRAAQVLLQQVAQHDAQHQRRHRVAVVRSKKPMMPKASIT
jgi:hypothetical protein